MWRQAPSRPSLLAALVDGCSWLTPGRGDGHRDAAVRGEGGIFQQVTKQFVRDTGSPLLKRPVTPHTLVQLSLIPRDEICGERKAFANRLWKEGTRVTGSG